MGLGVVCSVLFEGFFEAEFLMVVFEATEIVVEDVSTVVMGSGVSEVTSILEVFVAESLISTVVVGFAVIFVLVVLLELLFVVGFLVVVGALTVVMGSGVSEVISILEVFVAKSLILTVVVGFAIAFWTEFQIFLLWSEIFA